MMPHPRCLLLVVLTFLAACSGSDRAPLLTTPEAREDINAGFKNPDADPQRWVERFEGESREIFVHRAEIAAAVGLAPGERVADVGAGTGLFLPLFAEAVGEAGKVYAVDISPSLVRYMRRRVAETGLSNVEVVRSVETSTTLAEDVVDVVFLCDTYHHFSSYPQMLASIHGALVDGGRLIVVDFAVHTEEYFRSEFRHHRLGFTDEEILQCFNAARVSVLKEPRQLIGDPLTIKIWQAQKSKNLVSISQSRKSAKQMS